MKIKNVIGADQSIIYFCFAWYVGFAEMSELTTDS